MKIGILGTGIVGNTIGTALLKKGHQVMMGSRNANNEKAAAWVKTNDSKASQGSFEDAAIFGEIIFNCTKGEHSIEVITTAANNLAGKILIDVSNPLDFSKGMPPTLFLSNDTSLGETIQNKFPDLKVVKALNTLSCTVMIDPAIISNGDHNLFICGNDIDAKKMVIQLLHDDFGWKTENIIDLGDITNARGTEQILPLWIRLFMVFGNADFNFKIAR
ncbi:MAG: NAD(P)-binding domain-containing protein [Chitinophagaceae bacterium]|nr:NAD(P)-binding domain-containing protein [Chitinophagaceae bacterium]